MNEILSVKEVAAYLRVSRTTVWRWCQDGTLKAFRLGNVYRIHRQELERHVGVSLAGPVEDLGSEPDALTPQDKSQETDEAQAPTE